MTEKTKTPNEVPNVENNKPIVLTLMAQEYGLTVEDIMQRTNFARERIIVDEIPVNKK